MSITIYKTVISKLNVKLKYLGTLNFKKLFKYKVIDNNKSCKIRYGFYNSHRRFEF